MVCATQAASSRSQLGKNTTCGCVQYNERSRPAPCTSRGAAVGRRPRARTRFVRPSWRRGTRHLGCWASARPTRPTTMSRAISVNHVMCRFMARPPLTPIWPSPHVCSQTFSTRHLNSAVPILIPATAPHAGAGSATRLLAPHLKIPSSEIYLSPNTLRALVTKAQQAASTDGLVVLAASGIAAYYGAVHWNWSLMRCTYVEESTDGLVVLAASGTAAHYAAVHWSLVQFELGCPKTAFFGCIFWLDFWPRQNRLSC